MSAGEPLLIEEHYRLLERLIETGQAPKIELEYNSNLTVLPQKALRLWPNFKKISMGVSIDGPPRVNDYIRYPSKFDQVISNMKKLEANCPNAKVWFTVTVMAYNVYYFDELLEFCVRREIELLAPDYSQKPIFLVLHPLHNPSYFRPSVLPDTLKQQTQVRLKDFMSGPFEDLIYFLPEEAKIKWRTRLKKIQADIIRLLEPKEDISRLKEFLEKTQKMDRYRGQSVFTILPEISNPIQNLMN